MDRVLKICHHPLWNKHLKKIAEAEENRIFCRHDIQHFLDVARLMYIENSERELRLSKAIIYAAALLHDIGRAAQYEENTPHEKASANLAEKILFDCGFSQEEQTEILSAISAHRTAETVGKADLSGLLYRADKRSRLCLFCPAEKECNWPEEKKNKALF